MEARRYFEDLGLLIAELKSIQDFDESDLLSNKLIGPVWYCKWNTGLTSEITIHADYRVTRNSSDRAKITDAGKVINVDSDSITIEFETTIDQLTWADGKILIEQWYPKAAYPKGKSGGFGIGNALEGK